MRKFVIACLVAVLAVGLVGSAFATGRQIEVGSRSGGNWIPFWGTSYNGMRWQHNILQSQISYAGTINEVEFYAYYGRGGTFNAFKFILCHTANTSLSTTFASNYTGTPVTVTDLSAFVIPAVASWFPMRMSRTFTYNNTNHLLMEVQWLGRNATGEPIYTYSGTGTRRVFAYNDPNASSGSGDYVSYYTRLSFGAYTALEPTSLGRVKSMYR